MVEHERFCGEINRWWNKYHFTGSPSFVLTHRLKTLKEDLKEWDKNDIAFKEKVLIESAIGVGC